MIAEIHSSPSRHSKPQQFPVWLCVLQHVVSACVPKHGCAVLYCGVQGEVLDTKIDASLAKLYESRRRRDIYLGFAEDPVGFINTIIASHVSTLAIRFFQNPCPCVPAGQGCVLVLCL